MERNRSASPQFLSVPNTNRSGSANRAQNRSFFQKIQLPQASQDSYIPYDFSSYPITTQKFDIDITEERFAKLKEKISFMKNSLIDCKKCSELLQLISELEDIANIFTRSRVKMLNSFFEIYIILQEEIKKNKEISSKYQKLNQEIDNNLDCLTDRKVANKLKGLKNEVKYKSQLITELTERITCLENSNELKAKAQNSKTLEFEQLEKEKQIFFKTQTASALKPCKDCAAKKIELEALQSEIAKNKETIYLLKTKNPIKDPVNPLVKSMIELKKLIQEWWESKLDSNASAWKREGDELIKDLVLSVDKMAGNKVEQNGRELRSAVHRKICEIEADFMDLGLQDEKVKIITEKFLELPYLLKPLFDLLKDYEKKELTR